MVFNHFYTDEEFSMFVGVVLAYKIAANISISLILLFFAAEAARFVSKNVFERIYFKQELAKPTTTYLLFSDSTFSRDCKLRFHKKIFSDFKIRLSSELEEVDNEPLAKIRIVQTITLVRKKLRDNTFLMQHNTVYGAIRNLIEGSAIGFVFSLTNIIFLITVQAYLLQ